MKTSITNVRCLMWLACALALPLPSLDALPTTTPQTSDEFFAEGHKYYRTHSWDKAISNFSDSIRMREENAVAYLLRGVAYHAKGQLDKAIADFSKVIELDKWEYLAFYRRSKAYERQGKKELAAADEREFRRVFGLKTVPRTADEFYDRATYFEARGMWGDTVADYTEAVKRDPKLNKGMPFSSVYEKRGDVYVVLDKFEEALADYGRALEFNPNRAQPYLKRAEIYTDKAVWDDDPKMNEKALADYSEFIARRGKNFVSDEDVLVALQDRASIYQYRREFDKAVADYTEALKIDPQNSELFGSRGVSQADRGEYDKAIRDFDQSLALNPKSDWMFNRRGDAYRQLKEYDKAISDYSKAVELNPRYFTPLFNRGLLYQEKKEWDKAEADYTAAIAIAPKSANAYNNRGIVLFNKKLWDKALADFNQAIALSPKNHDAFNNRGVVYRNQEAWDKAIAEFNQAIALKPDYQIAYTNRAYVLRKIGKIAEAEADEKKAAELKVPTAKPIAPVPAPAGDDDDW